MPDIDFPDLAEDGGRGMEDPFGGGGVDHAIAEAGDSAVKGIGEATIPDGIKPEVLESMPDTVQTSIEDNVKSIPTNDSGNLGKTLQANVLDTLKDPIEAKSLVNDSMADAIKAKGSPANVTPDDVKNAYNNEVKSKIAEIKTEYKTAFSSSVDEALKDSGVKTDATGKAVLDKMIDDPEGAEADLNKSASDVETKDPNWKDTVKQKLKDLGSKILSYGAKALLVLAVCGALIPGTSGPIDKLANLAGSAASRVATVAANIVQAFLGPFIKSFWGFLKGFKGPLIVVAIIIVILIIAYLYKTFFKGAVSVNVAK